MFDRESIQDKSRWTTVTLRLPKEVIAEVDRIATYSNNYRYEVIAELLVLAIERAEAEDFRPSMFPP